MTENPTLTVPAPPEAPGLWAILELKGHLCLAGRVSEEEKFGAKMGRIDVLAKDGSPSHTAYFTGDMVYMLRYVSEAAARAKAAKLEPDPLTVWDLPQEVQEAVSAARAAKRERERKSLPAHQDPIDADVPFDPGYQADTAGGEVRPFREDDEEPDDDDFEDLDPADRPRF